MIAEAFLICALAVPATQQRLPFDKDDIKIIRMVTSVDYFKPSKRFLIIGAEDEWEWVSRLRSHGFSAWRLVRGASAAWDIEGSAFYQPIQPESLRMVFYLLSQPDNILNIRKVIQESTMGIEQWGFFVFDDSRTPRFKEFLPKEKWFRLPFRWHTMLIYQKFPKGLTFTLDGSEEREHGFWENFLKTDA